jgi:hypothetical protein
MSTTPQSGRSAILHGEAIAGQTLRVGNACALRLWNETIQHTQQSFFHPLDDVLVGLVAPWRIDMRSIISNSSTKHQTRVKIHVRSR